MQFKQCEAHESEFQKLMFGDDESNVDASMPPFMVGCGVCHQWFFSDLPPAGDSSDYAAMLSQVEDRLLRECPDHAHSFKIDSTVGC